MENIFCLTISIPGCVVIVVDLVVEAMAVNVVVVFLVSVSVVFVNGEVVIVIFEVVFMFVVESLVSKRDD